MSTRHIHRPRDTWSTSARYADLADRQLAAALVAEDVAEETAGLSPHERITCHLHRRWAHQCVSSPQHAIPVTGHRWCRGCQVAMSVAVDEIDGSVRLTCPRCAGSDSPANRQVVRACRASMAAARRRTGQALLLLNGEHAARLARALEPEPVVAQAA